MISKNDLSNVTCHKSYLLHVCIAKATLQHSLLLEEQHPLLFFVIICVYSRLQMFNTLAHRDSQISNRLTQHPAHPSPTLPRENPQSTNGLHNNQFACYGR